MNKPSIAILLYAVPSSPRDALTEPKYSKLAAQFSAKGFDVHSVSYHDSIATELADRLQNYDATLVWVNPIEQGNDRKRLDAMLVDLSTKGHFVSAHPEVILKMGTKEILYLTRHEEFGMDVKRYSSFNEFKEEFLHDETGIRILKQHRGNGGNGVFKINAVQYKNDRIELTHATDGEHPLMMTVDHFFKTFEFYFQGGGMLIDQPWNPNIVNGMVRCYLCGNKVAGFGYQEVNALYPIIDSVFKKPSQRFYFSQDCGLFQDLIIIMENHWIERLQQLTTIPPAALPVIWDADFFINDVNERDPASKYSLCEINASCVSPFPESAIEFIVEEVNNRIRQSSGVAKFSAS
ncbi:MAG: Cj0069 family protein [Flavisolibacter sp.]